MDLLVSETNRYLTWKMDQLGGRDIYRLVQDLTLPEFKAFLATLILIGLSPRGNYELYWSISPSSESSDSLPLSTFRRSADGVKRKKYGGGAWYINNKKQLYLCKYYVYSAFMHNFL